MAPLQPVATDRNTQASGIAPDPVWSELDRLAALERYAILDTPPEPKFDDLVHLAAEICNTPVALLSLVAEKRQWFKAEVGLGLRETPIDESICSHLLLRPGLTIVPDLIADVRFNSNPLVTYGPQLRFYAGVLLVTREGFPLGTLCVLDVQSRAEGLTEQQARALTTLATHAMDSLELRRLLIEREEIDRRQREATRQRARVVLASIADGVFALDSEWRFFLFNRAAEEFFQRDRHEVLGRRLLDAFPDALGATLERFQQVAESGTPATFETETGSRPGRIVEMRAVPMDGGIAVSFTDITEAKRSAEAQQVLIAELQHRTRNLLAVVRSLAAQTISASTSLDSFGRAFEGRLAALSRVQSLLSHRGGTSVPLRDLVVGELAAHGAEIDGTRIRVQGPEIELAAKAVQVVVLAIHELATNALKYGALAQPQAKLTVVWKLMGKDRGRVLLRWKEQGVELPPQGAERREGFGRQLIERALPYDLGARTRFAIEPDGVCCEIELPIRH